MALVEGDRAPAFSVDSTAGPVIVPDPRGRPTLVMFFQEAGTPACTQQVTSVAAERETLDQLGAAAVCLSTDPPERQAGFAILIGEAGLPLASDPDGRIARSFGVFDPVDKRAARSAFVVSGEGRVVLAIPWYNPANSDQLISVFGALGMELGAEDTEDG